jgi:integrase/recombinase XerD
MTPSAELEGSRTLSVMGNKLDSDVSDHLFWARDIRGLSSETIRVRRGVLDRLGDTIDMPLREAQIGHLQRWQQLVLPGKAAQTRLAYVNHVSAFYTWAVRQQIITENPAVLLTRPKVAKGLPHPIREEDLAFAIACARPKLAAMIVLTAYAGLRCMEVAGLNWSDIRQTPAGWQMYIRGKGRKERLIDVGEVVVRALRGHGWARRGPIFYGRDSGQITPNAVSQAINAHYARLDISSTAHAGRHRYISVGVEELGDVVLMQHMAGHESLATTQIYAAFSHAKASRLISILDARAGILPEAS